MSMNQENHVLTLARKAQLICETAPVAYWQESHDLTPYLDRYYQLVRNQALEDAAKVCDAVQLRYGQYTFTARISAEEIRQMKAPE